MRYERNHYVPRWYQKRFIPASASVRRFFYLDLAPEMVITPSGHKYKRNALRSLGPDNCFYEDHLYTTRLGNWSSTEIEQRFFGPIDNDAPNAIDYFSSFEHPSADGTAFQILVDYLSVQKLRTPKGLAVLGSTIGTQSKNAVLMMMQQFRNVHCAIWAEAVWSIWDASDCDVKFLVTDHPVTAYNQRCFPASKYCRGDNDPDITLVGTHTLFALDLDKLLVLTNLSWARNPYQGPLHVRPNPFPLRDTVFNYQQIQTHRRLTEDDVHIVNYVLKKRARRYIAATDEATLHPEDHIDRQRWDHLGGPYFFMPDPRSMTFTSGIFAGGGGRLSVAYDEYGRTPQGKGGPDDQSRNVEWNRFHAFQGEYARKFGPKRRGRSYEIGRLSPEKDDPDFHKYHLSLESQFRKH